MQPISGDSALVNARVLAAPTTGVQRYLKELLKRMPEVRPIAPMRPLAGIRGHAWEQFVLPARVRGHVLWSPSNAGPLAVRSQVVTVHEMVPFDHPEWLNPRFAALYRFLIPHLARRASHIIAVSHFVKQRLLAHCGINPSKITVIYSGVGQQFRPQTAETVARMRSTLRIPSGRYVLAVGTLQPSKNFGRLLVAWSRLLPTLARDVSLVIAGGNGTRMVFPEVPELRNLPARVHLVGHVSELLPALYADATVLVYPSLYEGFGLPPLEAMACGTPVISADRGSLPEVVGDAGILVDPYDVDGIATAIMHAVRDTSLRARLGSTGAEHARRFSWDETATKTREVLRAAADSQ